MVVLAYLKVEMRACGSACTAHASDCLPLGYSGAGGNGDSAQVRIAGGITVAMRNNNVQSVAARGALDGRGTRIGSDDGTSVNAAARNVNAAVETSPARAVGR